MPKPRRLYYNLQVLKLLADLIHLYPEIRFMQLLSALNEEGVDFFYEEPEATLERFRLKIHEKLNARNDSKSKDNGSKGS